MTLLESAIEWLNTYPGMERLSGFWVDDTPGTPDSKGILPKGMMELERKENILGNVETLNQYQFDLFYTLTRTANEENGAKNNAEWLLGLQDWVQAQSVARLGPTYEDAVIGRTAAVAEKGMLLRDNGDGTGTYVVTLTIKFKKGYGV